VYDESLGWPAPPPQSGLVLLRPFRPDDAAAVVEACRDPLICRFTFMEDGLTLEQAAIWIEGCEASMSRGNARFAIVDPLDERFFGQVGLAVSH
jgi:hypothetical protein